ncbi:hypothetical protein ES332_A10G247600v1 [Gossypium tomentosum]|uniref:Uncharacterized protein n=1 Tax=Gossypium tomentosum TaxID=34277 RepID=A0A5D2NWC7_GOSTO|nr:hypothetical protein ES332_A10G247600v1 [Gossypium tomentosum]
MQMFWHPCIYHVCAWLPVCHPQNLSNNDGICEWRMRSQAYISTYISPSVYFFCRLYCFNLLAFQLN